MERAYWLLKSEPEEWSWENQLQKEGGIGPWDGVRNALAQKHMKTMNVGDLCFFYHSGRKGREIVGIVSVASRWQPEPPDDESGKYGVLDVKALLPLPKPVTLEDIKAQNGNEIVDFIMLRQTRLSVVPVSPSNWAAICKMGEVEMDALEKLAPVSPENVKEQSEKAPEVREGQRPDGLKTPDAEVAESAGAEHPAFARADAAPPKKVKRKSKEKVSGTESGAVHETRRTSSRAAAAKATSKLRNVDSDDEQSAGQSKKSRQRKASS